jgi:hypothetical protein
MIPRVIWSQGHYSLENVELYIIFSMPNDFARGSSLHLLELPRPADAWVGRKPWRSFRT